MATRSGKQDKPKRLLSFKTVCTNDRHDTLTKAVDNVFGKKVNFVKGMNELMQNKCFDNIPWDQLTHKEWKLIKLCADAGPYAYTIWRAYHAKNTKSPK